MKNIFKTKNIIIIIWIVLLQCLSAYAENDLREIKDRLIRLEVKVEEGFIAVNKRYDDLKAQTQKQYDDLKAQTQKQYDDLKAQTQKQYDDLKAQTQKQYDDLKDDMRFFKEDIRFQMNELKTLFLWGFGILFGGMGLLIGFVLWDRRTFVKPIADELEQIKKEQIKVKNEQSIMKEAIIKYINKESTLNEFKQSLGFNIQPA